MLGDIAQDQVGRDRRDLVQAGFPELALDVVFIGKAEAAVELESAGMTAAIQPAFVSASTKASG